MLCTVLLYSKDKLSDVKNISFWMEFCRISVCLSTRQTKIFYMEQAKKNLQKTYQEYADLNEKWLCVEYTSWRNQSFSAQSAFIVAGRWIYSSEYYFYIKRRTFLFYQASYLANRKQVSNCPIITVQVVNSKPVSKRRRTHACQLWSRRRKNDSHPSQIVTLHFKTSTQFSWMPSSKF